jgi:DNA-binding transcriptional LysR family regulator
MNSLNLDLDTLRTLAVANDLGGYGHAAVRLGRTASAISLQMKRLQADVGATLFRKSGRGLELTEAGDIVLRYGRQILALNDELLDTIQGASLSGSIRLGFSQDFADTILPTVLARFSELYPLVLMEVRIEGNAALVQGVEKGELDIVLAVGQADRPTAQVLGPLELVWIAGEAFSRRSNQPLPLVLLGPQCAFRKEAMATLDASGIIWRVAATSPSLAGLWASAKGGLGLTLRTGLALPPGLVSGKTLHNLPSAGSFPITLHTRPGSESVATERLRAIVTESVTFHLRP